MDSEDRSRDWADRRVRRLRTTSSLLISEPERRRAAQRNLSPVMFDTLGRISNGGHTYPTRVRPLIERGLVADDGSLTDEGRVAASDLGISRDC